MKSDRKFVALAFLLAAGVWVTDALVSAELFRQGTFREQVLWQVPLNQVYARCLAALTILLLGLVLGRMLRARESARRALEESETRYRNLVEHSPYAVTLIQDGRLTYINPAGLRLLGASNASEVLGQEVLKFVHPEDRERIGERLQTVLRDQTPVPLTEERIQRLDNRTAYADVLSIPFTYQGRPAIQSMGRDVSGRRKVHAALDAERKQLLSIFDGMEEDVYVADPQTHELIYINRSLREKFGEVVGRKCHEALQGLGYPCPFCTNPHLFGEKAGAPYVSEFCNLVNRKWYRCVDKAIRWPDGRMVHCQIAADITEYREQAEALRLSEAKYRELVQSANSIIYRRDLEGRITFINEFALRFFGYAEEELLGRNVVGSIVPERDSAGRDMAAMIRDIGLHPEQYGVNENENMLRSGTRVWIAWTNRAICDQDGRVVEMLCVGNDITERRLAEKRLRESEEMYKTLLLTSPDPVAAMDLEGRLTYVSPRAAEALGYRRAEELLGLDLAELVAPQETARLRRDGARLLQEGAIRGAEYTLRRNDGGAFIAELNGALIRDDNGQPKSAIVTLRDITERRRHEEEREATLQLLRLVNASGDLLDLIRTCSLFLREWTGCSAVAVQLQGEGAGRTGTHSRGLYAETKGFPSEFTVREACACPHDKDCSICARVFDGRVDAALPFFTQSGGFWANDLPLTLQRLNCALPEGCPLAGARSAAIVPLRSGGKCFGLLHVRMERDRLTPDRVLQLERLAGHLMIGLAHRMGQEQRGALETQFRHAQKMEAVGRLAGGVAHDFNNLLTAILGYSELLQAKLGELHPGCADLEEIRKAGERAATLTRQLLAFSRKQVRQPALLDLNAVVGDLEKMLRRLIGEDVELRIVRGDNAGAVQADPGQLEQVIMNLAVNARDAMPRGGRLTISTMPVLLDASFAQRHVGAQAGPHVRLTVEDTGSGMDAETLSHVFEPFFTTKEQGKGTGLGLSTVYGIVQQSGGYVGVWSEPGRGSRFDIYLPRVADGQATAPAGEASTQPAQGHETVLLTEDDAVVRGLARSVLAAGGYTVLEAEDGAAACRFSEDAGQTIDLLLTDLVMPGMSGHELVRRVRAQRPEVAVVYMSGYADTATLGPEGFPPGTHFIAKPFTPESLARKVREALDARLSPVSKEKDAHE